MKIPLSLPSEASDDGELARVLARAIGPVQQPADGTAVAGDDLALGGALADARQGARDLTDEVFADTAYDLLDEWEAEYGLATDHAASVADRQAALVAKIRASRAGTPDSILTAVRVLEPAAVIFENTPASILPPTDPYYDDSVIPLRAGARRDVFRWLIALPRADFGTGAGAEPPVVRRVRALARQMQPAHASVEVAGGDPSVGFQFGVSQFGVDAFGT